MVGTRRKRNPVTPKALILSPQKRSTRKARPTEIEPDMFLPGNMLQHSFWVEGMYITL